VLRCLEVDPVDRYATAADVARALADPERIGLTERATRSRRDGLMRVARRRWRAQHAAALHSQGTVASTTPAIMAALNLASGMELLADAVRRKVLRLVDAAPATHVACVNVMKLSRIGQDELRTPKVATFTFAGWPSSSAGRGRYRCRRTV
jgi:eukaryotic-like serine/threonine-protein kinase